MRAVPAYLEGSATSAEDQVEDHDDQDQINDAAAIVANPGSHIVSATAENQQKNDEKDDKHRQECSTEIYHCLRPPKERLKSRAEA